MQKYAVQPIPWNILPHSAMQCHVLQDTLYPDYRFCGILGDK